MIGLEVRLLLFCESVLCVFLVQVVVLPTFGGALGYVVVGSPNDFFFFESLTFMA